VMFYDDELIQHAEAQFLLGQLNEPDPSIDPIAHYIKSSSKRFVDSVNDQDIHDADKVLRATLALSREHVNNIHLTIFRA
jgi:hypothetical protein